MRAGHKFSRRSVTYSSMGVAPAVRCCLSICLLLYTWICLSADAMYGCEPQHGTGIACSRFELSMSQVSLRLYSCHTAHGRNRPLRLSSRLSSMLLLVLAGDVEINPGPRRCKYPCGLCNLAVKKTDPAVCCDSCDTWIHNGCSGLSHNMYEVLKTPVVLGSVHSVECPHFHHLFGHPIASVLLIPLVVSLISVMILLSMIVDPCWQVHL